MIRSLITLAAIAVVLVTGALLLRPRSNSIELAAAAAMPPLEELHAMAGVHQLPDQDIDDQSLIFPMKAKQ